MKENGLTKKNMVLEYKSGQMAQYMKDIGKRVGLMGLENIQK